MKIKKFRFVALIGNRFKIKVVISSKLVT